MLEMTERDRREGALLLISLAGEWVAVERVLSRRAESPARQCLEYALAQGWVTGSGMVTNTGRLAVADWVEDDGDA